jgi:hypothetical protein
MENVYEGFSGPSDEGVIELKRMLASLARKVDLERHN